MTRESPLHWPDSWPRTQNPAKSQFKTTLTGALKNVRCLYPTSQTYFGGHK